MNEYSPSVRGFARAGQKMERTRKRAVRRAKKLKFDTLAVHGLYTAREALLRNQGSIIEPLYLSTAQGYESSDEMEAALAYLTPGWVYSRIANPTVGYLEETLALLESYQTEIEAGAVVTSSGMSAVFQALQPLLVRYRRGDTLNLVSSCHVYGGTFQQFSVRLMKERDVEVRWVENPVDLNEWKEKIDPNTRLLFGEVPSNPTLMFFDIEKVADLAHENGIPLIVDATVATPALLRPLAYGADMVIHSTSKSMTSSGLGIGGAIIARKKIVTRVENDELQEDAPRYLKQLPLRDFGPCLSPFNALLTLNDLRTLRPRMKRLSENTQIVATFLEEHPLVERVNYLGLEDHPLHDLATKYMTLVDSEHDFGRPLHRYGHLLSFQTKGDPVNARVFLDHLDLIYRATDLGRIKSIATIPAISTHQQQGEEARRMARISPACVRLSVGGEHPDDIVADLDRALRFVQGRNRIVPGFSGRPNGEVRASRGKKEGSRGSRLEEGDDHA